MSYEYSKDGLVEAATQEILMALDWEVEYAWTQETLAAQTDRCNALLGRVNKSEVLLQRYLLSALRQLNPDLPVTAYQQAVDQISRSIADKHLAAINKDKHALLVNGVPVSYQDKRGVLHKND